MLQADAEKTLAELTEGMIPGETAQRTASKRITVASAKKAGFVDAGSGLYLSADNEELGTKEGSFWEVKTGDNDVQYLERRSEDSEDSNVTETEAQKKEAEAIFPQSFSTTQEMYEYGEETGYKVSDIGEDQYVISNRYGNRATYQDGGSSVTKIASELSKKADIGNEPPLRTLPPQVELDTQNKYEEQGQERELSLSEEEVLTLVTEDLDKKGLDPLAFD